jgi:hypothetical protein
MDSMTSITPRRSPGPGFRNEIYGAVETALNVTFPAYLRAQSWSALDFLHVDYDSSHLTYWVNTSLVFHLSRELAAGEFDEEWLSVHGPSSQPFELDWAVTVADDKFCKARIADSAQTYVAGLTRVLTFFKSVGCGEKTLRSAVEHVTDRRRSELFHCHYFAYVAIVCHRDESSPLREFVLRLCREYMSEGELQVVVGYPWLLETSEKHEDDWNTFAVLQLVLARPTGTDRWNRIPSPKQHRLR